MSSVVGASASPLMRKPKSSSLPVTQLLITGPTSTLQPPRPQMTVEPEPREREVKGPPGGRPVYPFFQSTEATNSSLAQPLVPTNGFPSLSLTKLSTGRKWSNALVTNTPGSLLRISLKSNQTPPRQKSFARFWQGKGFVPSSKSCKYPATTSFSSRTGAPRAACSPSSFPKHGQ